MSERDAPLDAKTAAPVWMNDIQNYSTDTDIAHMAARGVILDSYMWVSIKAVHLTRR